MNEQLLDANRSAKKYFMNELKNYSGWNENENPTVDNIYSNSPGVDNKWFHYLIGNSFTPLSAFGLFPVFSTPALSTFGIIL